MIQFSSHHQNQTNTLVLPVFENQNQIEELLSGYRLNNQLTLSDFKGERAQTLVFYEQKTRLLLIGLGKSGQKTIVGDLGLTIAQKCAELSLSSFDLCLDHIENPHHTIPSLLLQIVIGLHRKNAQAHSSQKTKKSSACFHSIHIQTKELSLEDDLKKANAIGSAIAAAIKLANMPPNQCYPAFLATHVQNMFKTSQNITCNVLDEHDLVKEKLLAITAVGNGAAHKPRLIEMIYKPKNARNKTPIALIGKGVTFDSGGISLKPPSKMDEMKFDMCGASSTIATIQAIEAMEIPIYVVGIIAAAENMPGQNAYRPGDIITTRSGKTVEILNTDAEGRMLLCDAITYAKDTFQPQQIIDIATLTGAVISALGNHYMGIMGNHHIMSKKLLECAEEVRDYAWELPMDEIFEEAIDTPIADMANIATKNPGAAGSIIAGCFLKQFVDDTPWTHLDIAGVAWDKNKQCTGRPIAMLVNYLTKMV